MRKRIAKAISVVAASVLSFTLAAPAVTSNAANYEWRSGENGKQYWYEFGIRQGTFDDPNGVIGDGTVRGREIYDADTDAWYWLDSIYNGAKAVGKEVWMPYLYQNEDAMDDAGLRALAAESDAGMQELAYETMKTKAGKWVRYDENGKMLKGWVTIEGALAEVYPDQAGNTYYYDKKTGLMARGDITLGGVVYHFDKITGVCSGEGGVNDDTTKNSYVDYSERNLTAVMNLTDTTRNAHELAVGDAAPDFTVQLVKGGSFTLSDHENELTLVNIWATWCGPCVREMPSLQKIYDEKIPGVNIVCVNLGEYADTVNSFVEENKYTMNIGYDEYRTVEGYYPTTGIPYTVFVKDGVVVYTTLGSRSYDGFKNLIESFK